MTFNLSQRSLDKLEGVDERLVAVVKHAITVTKNDFGVICGLRTIEEQRELVAKGASKTMNSRHIGGEAVDLMCYVGSRGSWELKLIRRDCGRHERGGHSSWCWHSLGCRVAHS
jgi:peptidoglycan LD-endopeptidase CwlK